MADFFTKERAAELWPEATYEHAMLADRDSTLGVGHLWTNVFCRAYRTFDPSDCTCGVQS
jgi:hypothetical protein